MMEVVRVIQRLPIHCAVFSLSMSLLFSILTSMQNICVGESIGS